MLIRSWIVGILIWSVLLVFFCVIKLLFISQDISTVMKYTFVGGLYYSSMIPLIFLIVIKIIFLPGCILYIISFELKLFTFEYPLNAFKSLMRYGGHGLTETEVEEFSTLEEKTGSLIPTIILLYTETAPMLLISSLNEQAKNNWTWTSIV